MKRVDSSGTADMSGGINAKMGSGRRFGLSHAHFVSGGLLKNRFNKQTSF